MGAKRPKSLVSNKRRVDGREVGLWGGGNVSSQLFLIWENYFYFLNLEDSNQIKSQNCFTQIPCFLILYVFKRFLNTISYIISKQDLSNGYQEYFQPERTSWYLRNGFWVGVGICNSYRSMGTNNIFVFLVTSTQHF